MIARDQTATSSASRPALTRREVLFTLWVFVILLYAYCDILGLYDATILSQLLTGVVDGITMDQRMLVAASVLMMVKIVMVPITRLGPYRCARLLNIVVALLATAVMIATLLTPVTTYYLMFAVVEIATTAAMVWLAWTWRE